MHFSRGGPLEPYGDGLDVRKQGNDWMKPFENGPICFRKQTDVRGVTRWNTGIVPKTSTFGSAPISCGNKRVAPQGALTSTGAALVN
jgi:hypothetical protein